MSVSGRKVLLAFLSLLLVVALNFALIHALPGDPLVHLLGEEAYGLLCDDPAALAVMRADWGLDRPLPAQFLGYVAAVCTGDLGWSAHYGAPVARVMLTRLGWTLVLLVPAVVLSAFIGGWLGALAGWRRGADRALTLPALVLYSVPSYCLGLLLLLAACRWGGLPLGGMGRGGGDWLRHLALPLAVLVIHGSAVDFFIMRHAVRQELGEPYVFNAWSRGLTPSRVLWGHILRNALPPYVNVVALNLGFLVGGALLVEIVFAWQGMGTLMYEAVLMRDYPLLSGCLLLLSVCVILANLGADLLHGRLDPRVRRGGARV